MKTKMTVLNNPLTLVLLLTGVVVGGESGGIFKEGRQQNKSNQPNEPQTQIPRSFTSSPPPPDIINFNRCICDGNCENIRGEDCPAGLTLDFCGCCLQCARAEGEPCGGFAGNCAHGLHCAHPQSTTNHQNSQGGVCSHGSETEGCGNGVKKFGCVFHMGKCECGDHLLCPGTDQMFLFESENVCKSRISILVAKNFYHSQTIREATDKCDGIKCPALENCPTDSYRLPASVQDLSTQDCCPTPEKCVCDPQILCPKPDCPEGWAEKIVLNATGQPGNCCPIVECSLKHFEEEKVCLYSGKKYERGESWRHLEECAECSCSVDGVVTCQRIKCDLPAECRHARASPDSCCPLCVGCVTSGGKVYNNSESWMEDDCTLCECDEGRVKCHASMCQTQCENPVHVPGECCPRCEETHTLGGEKRAECGKVDCEGRVCEFGFLVDPRGCPSCRCNKCPSLTNDCPLDCPWGYELNEIGCATCSCREASSGSTQAGKSSVESWETNPRPARKRNPKRKQLDPGEEEGVADSRPGRPPKGNSPRNPSKLGGGGREIPKSSEPVPMPMVRGNENSWSSDGVKTAGESRKTSGPDGNRSDKRCISLDERHGEIEREDGEEWSDGCRHCICKLGVEMCSLITCSPPNCEHPVFYPGDCCPRCPDEEIFKMGSGGEHVVNITVCPSGQGERPHIEGDEWNLSSCLHCTCHNGLTLCSHRECSPTPCPSDRLVFLQSSCCARCLEEGGSREWETTGPNTDKDDAFRERVGDGIRSGSDAMTDEPGARSAGNMRLEEGELKRNDTGGDGKRNCYSDDSAKEYFHGSSWKVGPCQSCVCENGKIQCFSSSGKCPRLECERPVLAKNQCCPICLRKEEKYQGSHTTRDSQESESPEERGRKVDKIFSRGGLEPYCAAVIGALLCITSLMGLYILRSVYRRRRRRRLNDKSLGNPPPDYCFFNNNKNYERTRIGSSSTDNSLTEKNLLFSAN